MSNIKYKSHIFQKILIFFLGRSFTNFLDIPIIINNFNRLATLRNLIEDLQKRGYKKIVVLDNNSTYPPLLHYYEKLKSDKRITLYLFKKNYGSKCLWKSNVYLRYMFRPFCYTDSDLQIHKNCPNDFMQRFVAILKKYKTCYKVGFSLVIDDLPDQYNLKEKVMDWEKQFSINEIEHGLFISPIDTTFALYRPFSRRGSRDGSDFMIRTAYPMTCHHIPWYVDSSNLDDEEIFYKNSLVEKTHWSSK